MALRWIPGVAAVLGAVHVAAVCPDVGQHEQGLVRGKSGRHRQIADGPAGALLVGGDPFPVPAAAGGAVDAVFPHAGEGDAVAGEGGGDGHSGHAAAARAGI